MTSLPYDLKSENEAIYAPIRTDITLIKNIITVGATYLQPSSSLTNITTAIEKGSDLLGLSANITFTQNDAGVANSYSLKQDNIEISNTQNSLVDLTGVTSQIVFIGEVSYANGLIKNDNFGNPSSSGQVLSGTITSPSRTITPQFKNFLGFSPNSILTSSEIIALANGDLDNNKSRNYTGITAGSGNNLYYCYPSSYGDLSNIILDGSSPIIGAFTKLSNVNVTNSFGITEAYIIYKSNASNAFNNNSLNFS